MWGQLWWDKMRSTSQRNVGRLRALEPQSAYWPSGRWEGMCGRGDSWEQERCETRRGIGGEEGRIRAMEEEDGELTKKMMRDLVSGSIAGGTARMLVAPLDVVKIRFQVMNEVVEGSTNALRRATNSPPLKLYRSVTHALGEIISTEGVRALWKGNGPALGMIVPYGGIQFMTYHQVSRMLGGRIKDPYMSFIGGACSGFVATLFTYPLDLLRTRLAAQREPKIYNTMGDAVRKIYANEGIGGFYAGLQPTVVEIVPYIALHFTFYEGLKHLVRKHREDEAHKMTTVESFVAGGLSGMCSKLLTLPLDTVKKRMQVQGQFFVKSRYSSFGDVFVKVYRNEGIAGLFRGWQASVAKALPNSAITFAIFESTKRWLSQHT